jgi:hypothetical protein
VTIIESKVELIKLLINTIAKGEIDGLVQFAIGTNAPIADNGSQYDG